MRIIKAETRCSEFSDLFCRASADFHLQLDRGKSRPRKVFIEHSTPVLYFGHLPYRHCRVLTVANNPSFGEFPSEFSSEPQYRFAHSGPYGLIEDLSRVSSHQADSALRLMDTYFNRSNGTLVYETFFRRFNLFLEGLGMGTYREGTAAHADIATPFATTEPLGRLEGAIPQSKVPSQGVDWNDLFSSGLTSFLATLALCPTPKIIVGIGKRGFEALEPLVGGWGESREVEQDVRAYFGRLKWSGREFPIVWGGEPDRWFPQRALWLGTDQVVEQVGRGVAQTLRELHLVDP